MLPSPADSNIGQSSASTSSFSPSSLRLRDSMSSMSTAPTSHSHHAQTFSNGAGITGMNGILGTGGGGAEASVGKIKGLGDRARGFMGGRFGSARGPPPTGPPPLPPPGPLSQAGPSRPIVLPRTSSRLSLNPLTAPSHPPPSSSLPQPPVPSASHAPHPALPPPPPSFASTSDLPSNHPDDEYGRHRRQDSDMSSQSYTTSSSSQSVPPSPTAGPPISPRKSSLITSSPSISRNRSSGLRPAASISESRGESSSAPSRRVPSRQLLQTALDLAQQAVEMDQSNDVTGALEAYREAVTRLKSVMERVGMEEREGKRGKAGKAEEEGRTLRGIHDAYVARIQLLSSYENGEEAPSNSSLDAFPSPPSTAPLTAGQALALGPDRPVLSHDASSSTSLGALTPQSAVSQVTTPVTSNYIDREQLERTPMPMPSSSGERTPRPSVDPTPSSSEQGHGIGEFMLADQSFEPNTPNRPDRDSTPQPESPFLSLRQTHRSSIGQSSQTSSDAYQSAPTDMYTRLVSSSVLEMQPSTTVVLNEDPPRLKLFDPPARRESLGGAAAIGLGHPGSPPRLEDPMVGMARPVSLTSDGPSTPNSRRVRRHRPSIGLEDEAGLTKADGLLEDDEMEQMADANEETPSANGLGLVRTRTGSIDKTLPPLPEPTSAKGSGHSRQSSFGRLGQLISESTSKGTISQRRTSRNSLSPNVPGLPENGDSPPAMPSSTTMALPSRLSGSSGGSVPHILASAIRSRSKSQPGQRPDVFQAESADDVPPLPDLRKKASFPSRAHAHARMASDSLAPPRAPSYRSVSPSSAAPDSASILSVSGSLISPLPESQPFDAPHRPFHLLRTLHTSMDPDGPGAYLTGSIHIPSSIWSSASSSRSTSSSAPGPGPRITAQDTKVRIMDSLMLHLEIIRHTGAPLLDGPREVEYGVPGVAPPRIGIQAVAGIGQELLSALDGLEEEMDTVHKSLTKAGVVVGGWKGKKASTNTRSWGSKVVRSMDKMTSSKAIDSADKYVDLLAGLCMNVQILNDHLSNFTGPCTPAYHAVAEAGFRALEQRFLRSSEFVRVVLVPFVLDDFKQFLFRYLKAGMRYIED